MMEFDTICAISTPLGVGGIGIIRISGPQAFSIGKSLFKPAKAISNIKPYRLHHGWIISKQGKIIDEVLISYMPGPGSYTGEDVFEINCHGGPLVVKTVLEEVISRGARLAEPGEFTMRAFFNGRIDLSQAEAICELISSKGEKSIYLATAKLHGALKEKIKHLRQTLEEIMSQLVATIDFEDEDIDLNIDYIQNNAKKILEDIEHLIKNHEHYQVVMDGAKVVLCGEVNVGKSSILNAILGRERAIVTPIPGTTRDYIEDMINIEGIPVKIIDTAGIRHSKDEIEIIGVSRGIELIKEADIICLVFDSSKPISKNVQEIVELKPVDKIIAVANKIDLTPHPDLECEIKTLTQMGIKVIEVSAKTGKNIDLLLKSIAQKIMGNRPEPTHQDIVPNLRQLQQLKQAREEIISFITGLNQNTEIDLLYLHVETAVNHLKEITGEIVTEDILDKVFANFCIGK